MAWLSMNYSSKALNMPVELEVIYPQNIDYPCKVCVLLHGAFGDRTSWLLRSQIEVFASERKLCVVMPSAKNSFYVNMNNGYKYMDYITKELPVFIKNMFAVSDSKEDWMIAGCSMGGYGAIRCGVEAKDTFGYIAAFSGAFDMVKLYDLVEFTNMSNIYGSKETLLESKNNLYKLLDDGSDAKYMITCGRQDDLYPINVEFVNHFKDKLDMVYLEKDGGHDWHLWNTSIRSAIAWFMGDDNYKEVF